MENLMCRQCGKHPFVGCKYAHISEMSIYELSCRFCRAIEDAKRKETAESNKKKCRWLGHKWGENRLHAQGLAKYCQREYCGAEKIIFCH